MHIRPLALAIIWRGDQILVSQGYDHQKQQSYYRPLGGGIEFGECASDALLREFREEIDADLTNLQYLNVIENIFEYEGKAYHELVMVFQADFADHSFFEKEEFEVVEQTTVEKGYWKSMADFDEKTPLYPMGLTALLFPEAKNYQDPNLTNFDELWNFSKPNETEQAFRQLLPMATTSGNIDYYLQLLTQIARTQGLQQHFEAAHATLNEVSKELNKVSKRTLIRYLLERGRVYNSSGEVSQSKPIFTEAWEIAQQSGEDFYAIDAAHMLAIVETPEQQILWNECALQLAEQSKDPKAQKWLGSLYNNLGWTYHDLKQYDQALDLFLRGLLWRESVNDESGAFVARWSVARTYRSLGQLDEALALQQRLLDEINNSDNKLPPDGYVLEEIAECLLALGKDKQAKPYFTKAYKILSEDIWLIKNEAPRLARLKTLGAK